MTNEPLLRPYIPHPYLPCPSLLNRRLPSPERQVIQQSFTNSEDPNSRINISTIPTVVDISFLDAHLSEGILYVRFGAG